jgi:hypothetical protein
LPRRPSKPKKGEPFRMHIVLPGEMVMKIDEVVDGLKMHDPFLDVTRTYAVKVLLDEALKARSKKG